MNINTLFQACILFSEIFKNLQSLIISTFGQIQRRSHNTKYILFILRKETKCAINFWSIRFLRTLMLEKFGLQTHSDYFFLTSSVHYKHMLLTNIKGEPLLGDFMWKKLLNCHLCIVNEAYAKMALKQVDERKMNLI